MMRNIFILLIVIFNLYACENTQKKSKTEDVSKSEVVDNHNAENSLDYTGTYRGLLPCASCVGIMTTIELNSDSTFTKQDLYLSNKDSAFTEEGSFSFNKDGSTIVLKSNKGDTFTYRVEEGSLLMLNSSGEESGSLPSDLYRLSKLSDLDLAFTNEAVTGLLTLGHEVSVFQVLGSSKVYWITDLANGELDKMYKEKVNAKSSPYTPLIATLVVNYTGKAKEGFPEQYDGVLVLKEIKYMEQISTENYTRK